MEFFSIFIIFTQLVIIFLLSKIISILKKEKKNEQNEFKSQIGNVDFGGIVKNLLSNITGDNNDDVGDLVKKVQSKKKS